MSVKGHTKQCDGKCSSSGVCIYEDGECEDDCTDCYSHAHYSSHAPHAPNATPAPLTPIVRPVLTSATLTPLVRPTITFNYVPLRPQVRLNVVSDSMPSSLLPPPPLQEVIPVIIGPQLPTESVKPDMTKMSVKQFEYWDRCRKTIEAKGGFLLSSVYTNNKAYLDYFCGKAGHSIKSITASRLVDQGTYCKECANESLGSKLLKYETDDLHEYAKSRGGTCLETAYTGKSQRCRFKCDKAYHEVFSYLWSYMLLNLSWCPGCEKEPGYVKNTTKPAFMTRPSKRKQFIASLPPLPSAPAPVQIVTAAITADEATPDEWIVIDIDIDDNSPVTVAQPIAEQVLPFNQTPAGIALKVEPDITKMTETQLMYYNRAKAIVEARGGVLLSTFYTYAKHKLKVACGKHDPCEITARHLTDGHYCGKCGHESKSAGAASLQDLQRYAASHGGTCLATSYVRGTDIQPWKCHQPHHPVFHATWNGIGTSKSWCKPCAIDKLRATSTLGADVFRKTAEGRGGRLISDPSTYVNSAILLQWACDIISARTGSSHGEFPMSWDAVRNGEWCPKCWEERRGLVLLKPIEEFHTIAEQMGGRCLEIENFGGDVPHRFKCHDAMHPIFSLLYRDLSRGTWCPYCRGSNLEKAMMALLFALNMDFIPQAPAPQFRHARHYDFRLLSQRAYVETDGLQHAMFVEHLHKTYDAFIAGQIRDFEKSIEAIANGDIVVRIDFRQRTPESMRGHLIPALAARRPIYYSDRVFYAYLIDMRLDYSVYLSHMRTPHSLDTFRQLGMVSNDGKLMLPRV